MKKTNPKMDAVVIAKSLRKDAAKDISLLKKLSIVTKEDFTRAGEAMKRVKAVATAAKTREEGITEPLKGVIEDVRSLFKPFRDEVKELEETIKAGMLAYTEKSKKLALKVMDDYGAGKIKKLGTVVSKQAELEIDSNVRRVWTAVEVDTKKTPREYLVPDEKKIREALKEGKKVAGWKWEQVDNIVI